MNEETRKGISEESEIISKSLEGKKPKKEWLEIAKRHGIESQDEWKKAPTEQRLNIFLEAEQSEEIDQMPGFLRYANNSKLDHYTSRLKPILDNYFKREVLIKTKLIDNEFTFISGLETYYEISLFVVYDKEKETDWLRLRIISDPYKKLELAGKMPVKGKARGYSFYAGIEEIDKRNNYMIVIQSISIDPLLTPKKIPSILDRLNKKFGIEATNWKSETRIERKELFFTDFPPMKFMAAAATTNKEEAANNWEKRDGLIRKSENAILSGKLKESEFKVYFDDKVNTLEGFEAKRPTSSEELQVYLAAAFGAEAYRVLLGLAYLGSSSRQRKFRVDIHEFAKLLYGNRPAGGAKEKLIQTIAKLNQSQITLTQPAGKNRYDKWIFYPLKVTKVGGISYQKGSIPRELELAIFPLEEGNEFKSHAIPEKLLEIRKNLFPLAVYLMVKARHFYGQENIKLDLEETIKAANLHRTYLSNSRKARADLKHKLIEIAKTGIVGELIEIDRKKKQITMRQNKALTAAAGSKQIGDKKE